MAQDTTFMNTYGGEENDHGRAVIKTYNGGYLIAGSSSSFGSNSDIYVVQIDSTGKHQWSKTYGGAGIEWGYSVTSTYDSNYVIAGTTSSSGNGGYDGLLIKIDTLGNLLWQKTFGGADWDFIYSVEQTSDSGFILAGETYSFGNGNNDIFLVKTGSDGDTAWTKTYGNGQNDFANSAKQTYEGGFVVAGASCPGVGKPADIYIIKTNQSGDTTWTRRMGGDSVDIAYSIIQCMDSGYVVTGATASTGAGKMDFYSIKLDMSGDTVWTDRFGGPENDEWLSVAEDTNGNILLAGYSYSTIGAGKEEVFLQVRDKDGYFVMQTTFGGAENERGHGIMPAIEGGYIIVGSTKSFGMGFSDVFVIKTFSNGFSNNPPVTVFFDTSIAVTSENRFMDENFSNPFPNPANNAVNFNLNCGNATSFSVKLYNELGRLVFSYSDIHSGILTIERGSLPDGIYHYIIEADKVYSGNLMFVSGEK